MLRDICKSEVKVCKYGRYSTVITNEELFQVRHNRQSEKEWLGGDYEPIYGLKKGKKYVEIKCKDMPREVNLGLPVIKDLVPGEFLFLRHVQYIREQCETGTTGRGFSNWDVGVHGTAGAWRSQWHCTLVGEPPLGPQSGSRSHHNPAPGGGVLV